jgi:hypothetical protein
VSKFSSIIAICIFIDGARKGAAAFMWFKINCKRGLKEIIVIIRALNTA